MPLKEAKLLLLVAVAILLFIATTDCQPTDKNMTTQLNHDLRHSSIANSSYVEYNAPDNSEPGLMNQKNTSRIKIMNDTASENTHNDINLDNNKYDSEKVGTISVKRSEHGHHKNHNHHKHKNHHSGKAHKNKHDQIAPQPKYTKRNRDATTPQPPSGYPKTEGGDDWSCGTDLNLLCCPAVLNSPAPSALLPTLVRSPCRCRCKAMPAKWDDNALVPLSLADDQALNGVDSYCKNTDRGWATLEVTTEKESKKPERT